MSAKFIDADEYVEVETLADDNTHSTILLKKKQSDELFIKKIIKNGDIKLFNSILKLSHQEFTSLPYIFEIIQEHENVVLIEEYVKGTNILDILKDTEDNNLSIDETSFIDVIFQICDSVTSLRTCNPNIAYKILSAENIVICENNLIKIVGTQNIGTVPDLVAVVGAIDDIIKKANIRFSFADKYILDSSDFEDATKDIKVVQEHIKHARKSKKDKYRIYILFAISFFLVCSRLLKRFL